MAQAIRKFTKFTMDKDHREASVSAEEIAHSYGSFTVLKNGWLSVYQVKYSDLSVQTVQANHSPGNTHQPAEARFRNSFGFRNGFSEK
jgi:hypothetical protein